MDIKRLFARSEPQRDNLRVMSLPSQPAKDPQQEYWEISLRTAKLQEELAQAHIRNAKLSVWTVASVVVFVVLWLLTR